MSERRFDIVVFGATGFTGGLVAEYLAKVTSKTKLKWALAGRSHDKLQAIQRQLGLAASAAPELIEADVTDETSVKRMVQQTRVLLTTVGPYARHGEHVLAACAELGTDYVDLTGEPAWVRSMIERHHATAERNRVKIVNACGFDSIPHDLGAYFTLQRLLARLSPEQRARESIRIDGVVRAKGGFSGGTWHSILEIMSQGLGELRNRERWQQTLQQGPRKASIARDKPRYRSDLGLWTVPLPTIDPEVVARSAKLLPEYGADFCYGHYLGLKNAMQVAGLLSGVGTLFMLAQLPPTRALLLKVKDPGEGPSAQERANSWFRVSFQGEAAGKQVRCEVRGGDPGYGETAKMLSEAALCLAFDRDRLSACYGVVPPAAAMGNALIERLQNAGIAFTELGLTELR